MKTRLLFLMLLLSLRVLSQESIILKPGDSRSSFMAQHLYRFPAFVPAKVFYKDGAVIPGKLNYNQMSGKIDLINPKGDTLEFTDDEKIKQALLDKSIFLYDKVYIEVLKDLPAIKLGARTQLKYGNQRKVGAMGIPSSTMAMDTYSTMADGSGLKKLTPNVEHVFYKSTAYYFGDANYRFMQANQQNLVKLLPDKKNVIAEYTRKNRVNFSRLEDILALLDQVQGS